MKRVFSSVTYGTVKKGLFFYNDFISQIYEGIHNSGGEVLTMHISCISYESLAGEHLLITYEDNDHYKEINKILDDKKDNFKSFF